jgi:zinc protease
MKKLFIYSALLLSLTTTAQVDRTKAPTPGPAPIIKIGEPASFVLPNGLKVFVVTNSKLPRVSATLTIDREPIFEGNKAGLISMAGQLMRRGTASMNKAVLDEEVDYLGGYLATSASNVSGGSLKTNFPALFKLMADVALRPSFPADELEKIRKQTISGLAQQKESPDAIANKVVSKLVYGKNHPYGENETETTVANVQVADIKKYYATYWKPNIAYLIFVGDITVAEAQKLANTHFAKWQKGIVPKPVYPTPPAVAKTYIAVVDKPSSVQSVINLVNTANLKPGAPDAIGASLLSDILGGGSSSRLYKNLREKYGFTYGAYSSISTDKLVGNFTANASVRNEKTDSSIAQFLLEFNRIRNEAISAEEISIIKNEKTGAFARRLENPATIADYALNVARYNLPKNYYQNYLTNLAAVTAPQLKTIANKYIQSNNMHIVIVGNAKEIAKGLEKYGEVKYFDIEGNPMKAPETKTVDPTITGESIITKAAAAWGNSTDIANIKDIELIGTANLMGMDLQYSQTHILPNNFMMAMKMQGMTMMKQTAKNGEYKTEQQGQQLPLTDEDKDEIKESAAFFNEAFYLANKYQFTVKGIEQVDGADAYVVDITAANNRKFTVYYNTQTFLRVKDVKEEDAGPQGKIQLATYYKEYKEYNGIQVPVKLLIDQGQLKINVAIKDVKINQGLTADSIK